MHITLGFVPNSVRPEAHPHQRHRPFLSSTCLGWRQDVGSFLDCLLVPRREGHAPLHSLSLVPETRFNSALLVFTRPSPRVMLQGLKRVARSCPGSSHTHISTSWMRAPLESSVTLTHDERSLRGFFLAHRSTFRAYALLRLARNLLEHTVVKSQKICMTHSRFCTFKMRATWSKWILLKNVAVENTTS